VAAALRRSVRADVSAFTLREAGIDAVDTAVTDAASKRHNTPDNSLLD
jgi:hypothetical protein